MCFSKDSKWPPIQEQEVMGPEVNLFHVGRFICVQSFMTLGQAVPEISWFKVCVFKRLLWRPLVANQCNFWFMGSFLHFLPVCRFSQGQNSQKK